MIEQGQYLDKIYPEVLKNNPTSIIFHDYRSGETLVQKWGLEKESWKPVNEKGIIYERDGGVDKSS